MLKLAGLSMLGTMVGELLSEVAPHSQVSGDWTVDLRTVCAVGTVVFVGAWKVSGWQKNIADRLSAVEKAVSRLPCGPNNGEDRCDQETKQEL